MLRDRVCEADGRDPQPSAAVLDSQSAKSAEGGEAIGYDAGKRVRGRKRHLLVDTCGLVLSAVVSPSVPDRVGARLVLTGISGLFPQLGLVWWTAAMSTRSTPASSAGRMRKRTSRSWRCRATPPCEAFRCCPVGGWWKDLRLVGQVQTVGAGLRTQDQPRRGDDQGRDDPVDGRPPGRGGRATPRPIETEAARRLADDLNNKK